MSKQAVAPEGRRTNNRSRWVVIIMLASFVLPFVIGNLAYKQGWYTGGVTNKGQLLNPPLALTELALQPGPSGNVAALKGRWWLVYVIPEKCDQACQFSLDALPRLQASLGREQSRVGVLLVQSTRSAVIRPVQVSSALYLLRGDAQVLDSKLTAAAGQGGAGHWYILDPMGWIMLHYKPADTEKGTLQRSQDAIDDLQKLLKESRIG